ncbi:MAG: PHP domain-containing protein [Clostridia bacterium]|nr:PHP domain-containing protein [Clostridia bacterium]
MLIDLHAHTSGISKCSRLAAPEIIVRAKAHGMDGIALTNHYQKSYFSEEELSEFVDSYINEYYYTKEVGEKFGVKVLYGIEVTMELYHKVHMLIYGVDTDFLKRYPTVYEYTQEELYKVVKAEGGVLVQAHPFRGGTTVLDTKFLDGVEISCHPLYKESYTEKIIGIAKDNNLAVTVGGDYHGDTQRVKCGIYLPDDIDSIGLGKYIASSGKFGLYVTEASDGETKEITYEKEG